MSKEKWTEVKTKQFVIAYIQQPTLWNSAMPEYLQKAEVKFLTFKCLQIEK